MDPNEKRALELFDDYLEMSPTRRVVELARLERKDPALHRELVGLLRADARPGTFVETSIKAAITLLAAEAAIEPDDDPNVGSLVGSWQITGIIGSGGMGTVYRAERADGQYQQTVALKYIRDEVSSSRLVDAFVNERNVLARLMHPDIVPLLDGGVDVAGRPWYAMQLVDGDPIDQWCDKRRLTIRQRVVLLLRACEPVDYAHRSDVLHQDIKPSNILVTPDGRPRLLDFGLSIFMAPDMPGDHHRIAISSGYTPPEVMQRGAPGVHTDIYALGVVFYQLLCGQYPVPLSATHHRPQLPSRLVDRLDAGDIQARAGKSKRKLARQLKGDLDRIASRCVATDPCARYASVEDLQQDLRAWLDGRPISADSGSWGRSLAVFLRTRRWPLSILAGSVLFTAIGLFGWQVWRAERESALSSQTDRFFESTLGLATLSGLGDVPPTPLELLERSERQLRQQLEPGTLARGLSILARSWVVVGDYGKAESLAQEAQQATSRRDALQSAFNLATLAHIQNLRARHGDAEATALEGLDRLSIRMTSQHRLARVRLMAQLAMAQAGQSRSQDAFETLDTAISDAQSLPRQIGNSVVAQLLIQRGIWFRWRMRMGESEADLLRAIDLADANDPILVDDARESLIRTVRASRQPGRETRALKLAHQLLESRQATLGQRHPQTGMAWAELAFMQMLNTDLGKARESAERARDIMVEALGTEHPAVARAYMALGHLDAYAGALDKAFENTGHARRIYEAHYGEHQEFTLESRFLMASHYWTRGARTGNESDLVQARDLIGSTIAASVAAHGDVSAHHRGGYAMLLTHTGRKEEAAVEIERAKRDAARQFGSDSQDAMMARLSECGFLVEYGDNDEYTRQAMESLAMDSARIDTLFATGILHSLLGLQANWLSERGEMVAAMAAARQQKEAAVRIKNDGLVAQSDDLIRSLEAKAGERASSTPDQDADRDRY